ncbi:MAG: zinc-dependent alcohol dehydrogenase family protein [Bacteroidales bacterium]
MKAMILNQITNLEQNNKPLKLVDRPKPQFRNDEVLIRVSRCGVCHTEIDEIEGRTAPPEFPIILGHQVVGYVDKCGKEVEHFKGGERVGVAWIFSACGTCKQCKNGHENLCYDFKATGRDAHGGYAEYMAVSEKFVYLIPEALNFSEAAPLLCAGAIGYRSLRLTNLKNGHNLGLTGFGASGHLVLKTAKFLYPDSSIFVFARSPKEREFALELGAVWAGDTEDTAPEKMDAIIDTTPVWKPIVEGLRNLDAAGRLVINAIRKENHDIEYLKKLDYPEHLWLEKEIKSVANIERRDVSEFLELAAKIPIKPAYVEYPLEDANEALMEIKQRKIRGAKVLKMD